MSNFTCQSKSFINIFSTCQVSACDLQPFSFHNLANDIYSETAKTVFSHLKSKSDQYLPTTAKSHAKVLRQPSSQASLLPVPTEEREPGNEVGLERKKEMMKKYSFTFA